MCGTFSPVIQDLHVTDSKKIGNRVLERGLIQLAQDSAGSVPTGERTGHHQAEEATLLKTEARPMMTLQLDY